MKVSRGNRTVEASWFVEAKVRFDGSQLRGAPCPIAQDNPGG